MNFDILQHLFKNSDSNSVSTNKGKRKQGHGRLCRIEELESRDLLSVTTPCSTDYDELYDIGDSLYETDLIHESNPVVSTSESISVESISAMGFSASSLNQEEFGILINTLQGKYADLGFSSNIADYNKIIIIESANLSEAALREAINTINTTPNNGLNNLIIVHTSETQNKIELTQGELAITGNVTIVSLGTANLTIDANHQSRVFNITEDSTAGLAGLTITNGKDNWGGGIYSEGTLTITHCTITKNLAVVGGGIVNYFGKLTMTHSHVTHNTASGDSVIGPVKIGYGGGIDNWGGTLIIGNCFITDNNAQHGGGGIYNYVGILTLISSTITGNVAEKGSGVYNEDGKQTIIDCTIENTENGGRHSDTTGQQDKLETPSLSVGTISIELSWGKIEGAEGYEIEYSTDEGNTWKLAKIIEGNDTFATTVSGLPGNLSYQFRIKALSSKGTESEWSDPAKPIAKLDTPALTAGESTTESITLSWNTIPGATEYIIQRYCTETNDWVDIETVNIKSTDDGKICTTTIDNLQSNTLYQFRIQATAEGYIDSYWSTSETIRTATEIPKLIVDTPTTESVTLSWNAIPGATGYEIRYSTDNGTTWTTQSISDSSTLTATIDDLDSNTSYLFQIRATSSDDTASAWSESETVRTAPTTNPLNLRVTQTTQTVVSLQWNKIDGAEGYEIYYRRAGTNEWLLAGETEELSAIISQLESNTEYEFYVRTTDSNGDSVCSPLITVTTSSDDLITAPIILETVTQSNGQVKITWTDLGPDYTYTIYRQGVIVARNFSGDCFIDDNPLSSWDVAEYAIRAYNRVTQSFTNVVTTVAWNTTVLPIAFAGYDITTGGIRLFWDVQEGMTYQVLQRGVVLAEGAELAAGEWIDSESRAIHDYVLVAFYTNDNGEEIKTFSNTLSVKL